MRKTIPWCDAGPRANRFAERRRRLSILPQSQRGPARPSFAAAAARPRENLERTRKIARAAASLPSLLSNRDPFQRNGPLEFLRELVLPETRPDSSHPD